jgi:hypothetical protein
MENTIVSGRVTLDKSERERLRKLAQLFGLQLTPFANSWILAGDSTGVGGTEWVLLLDHDTAHFRLLSELCERVLPWVHFYVPMPCQVSLFRVTDERFARIKELREIAIAKKLCMDVADGDTGFGYPHTERWKR